MNCKKETSLVIYKCTNKINGKIYIGKTTKGLQHRIKTHQQDNLAGVKSNQSSIPFHNALNKYGFENFVWEVIDTAKSEVELNEKEIYWILKLQSQVQFGKGYNINVGGTGGDNFTNNPNKEVIRKRMSDVHKSLNKHLSDEHKNKLIEGRRRFVKSNLYKLSLQKQRESLRRHFQTHKNPNFGRTLSQSTKSKISQSLKGRFVKEKNPNFGNQWSFDKRKQLSEYFKETRNYIGANNPNSKAVKFYNIETEQIEEYCSRKEFCDQYNFKYDTVQQNLTNNKIIGKIFIGVPAELNDTEIVEFVQKIKNESRWYKSKK